MSAAHTHLQWSFPLAATSALVALLFLRSWLRLRSACPNLVPTWRLAAFMSGLLLVWIAAGSALTTFDHRSLTLHMVKHLLLMTVAAPLVLVGAPGLVLSGVAKRLVQTNPALRRPARWLGRCLTHPVSCWLVATVTVIGWHLPAAFQLAMRSPRIHSVEDASFLLAGLLFWWPVLQPFPNVERLSRWSMVLYLFLATLPCDILSAFLVFCNRLVYPSYLSTTQLFSLSPQQDQECAGALMWVWVTFAYLIPAVVITMQILLPQHSRAHKPVQTVWSGLSARSLNAAEPKVP
jgi:putative membrane protein